MSEIVLEATTREEQGRHVHALRRTGLVPAVIYGHNVEAQSVSADARALRKVWQRAGRTHLIDVVVDGGTARKAVIREFQTNPRTNAPIHADFFVVNLKEKLTADIPLVLTGTAPAVAEHGVGQLLQALGSLRVECLPQDLPSQISVDVSNLNALDDSVAVRDIPLPAGVTSLHADEDDIVVKIAPVRVQSAADAAADAAPAAAAAAAAVEAAEASETPAE